MKPLCIDLFCGLGGWAEGFLAEGYDVIGFDIERHDYGTGGYPGQLVLQDVLTLRGSQFKDAAVIVASPPCQAYSYMAMPWKRAKEQAKERRENIASFLALNCLFNACFRIAHEAGVPLIVENVRGAQPWVGRSAWNYGSFHLWGDVPALMPTTGKVKSGGAVGDDWFVHHNRQEFFDRANGHKNARNWWSDGKGNLSATTSSHSAARKAASAQIAKIPFPLAQHIARVFKPESGRITAK